MNTYQRESKEFVGVVIQKNREAITNGVFFAVLMSSARPEEINWVPAAIIDGKVGFILDNHEVGVYTVWIRIVTDLEDVVKKVDSIRII